MRGRAQVALVNFQALKLVKCLAFLFMIRGNNDG